MSYKGGFISSPTLVSSADSRIFESAIFNSNTEGVFFNLRYFFRYNVFFFEQIVLYDNNWNLFCISVNYYLKRNCLSLLLTSHH